MKALIEFIVAECSIVDREQIFDDMMDECTEQCAFCKALGSPSRILKECDPIAYRCGVNDYFGSSDEWYEIEGETYRKEEVEEKREEFIAELQRELGEKEREMDDDEEENTGLKQEISALEIQTTEAEKYAF